MGEAGGDAMLLGTIGATRSHLTVVASFMASELDQARLRTPGAKLLHELLTIVEARAGVVASISHEPSVSPDCPVADRLITDLGERLYRLGYLVETGFSAGGDDLLDDADVSIPLVVGHPDIPGEMLVAILTDDASYVSQPSVRVRDRQNVERLENLGWTVTQVWSAAAFLDPVGETDRIRRIVQSARDARLGTA
jgi:hypothetical protein